MPQDRLDHLARIAALLEDPAAEEGCSAGVGVLLVVEVVDQPGEAPDLLVAAELLRVGAHGGLHGQGVLAQAGGLGVLVEQGEHVVAHGDVRTGGGGRIEGREFHARHSTTASSW